MALDFPNAPTANQVFGNWRWDGSKWAVNLGTGGSGVPEAPNDGNAYGRGNGVWSPVLKLVGGTVAGTVVLSGGGGTMQLFDNGMGRIESSSTLRINTTSLAPTQFGGSIAAASANIAGALSVTAPAALVATLSRNAVIPAVPYTDGVLALVGSDGAGARAAVHAFGGAPALGLYRANGTAAAQTAVLNNDVLGIVAAYGFGATGYSGNNRANVSFLATQNWTDTAQGTQVVIAASPLGSAGVQTVATFAPSGVTLAAPLNGGAAVFTGNLSAAAGTFSGTVTAADLQSNLNVNAPSGYGYFGSYIRTNGYVAVGGNTTPALTIYNTGGINYTTLYAADGLAGQAGILLGPTTDKANYYRNEGHHFQNRAGSLTTMTITNIGQVVTASDVITEGTLYFKSVGDPGASQGQGALNAKKLRFRQNAGEDNEAGSIDYGGFNASLSIIGMGGIPRKVKIWDELTVAGAAIVNNTLTVNQGGGQVVSLVTPSSSDCYTYVTNGIRQWKFGLQGYTNPGEFWFFDMTANRMAMKFDTGGTVYIANHIAGIVNNGGQCGTGGNAWNAVYSYAFTNASDPAEKSNIEVARERLLQDALARVDALRPITFNWKHERDDAPKHFGFSATDVHAVMGDDFAGWMKDEKSGRQFISYNDLTAVLWAAVQELSAQVQDLRRRQS
jgi:hypothetical protein